MSECLGECYSGLEDLSSSLRKLGFSEEVVVGVSRMLDLFF